MVPPRRWRRWWHLSLLTGVALLLALALRSFVVQPFLVPSESMAPELEPGDRVLVSRLAYRFGEVRRGDLVVFDGRGSLLPRGAAADGVLARAGERAAVAWGLAGDEATFVKRVVGLPGERVACCDAEGRLTVDGAGLDETYLRAGEAPAGTAFVTLIPPGRYWVMGDARGTSVDSRAHLGSPGGGTVPREQVVGRVVAVYWPPERARAIGRVPAGPAQSEEGA